MLERDFKDIARIVERKQGLAGVQLAPDSRPIGDGWMACGGRGSFMNRAAGFGFDRPLTARELDELEAFFADRGVEPQVELSPFTVPSLVQDFARRGFTLRAFENVLARSLKSVPELPVGGWPNGVTIERVDPKDEATVLEYAKVSMSGFLPEGEEAPAQHLEMVIRGVQTPTFDAFLARVDGVPAGGAGSESSDGSTSLFGTSVKPEFRRRGLQQALILARLRRGIERGSKLAIIISGPGIPTERNAARLGFEMVYSRVVLAKSGEGLMPSPL